jgi:hypothetical protein
LALELVRAGSPGDRREAAIVLHTHDRLYIQRRLQHGHGKVVGMSEEDAEDNLFAVIERFTKSNPDGRTSGLTWLNLMIDGQALDFHRRRRADKRGGGDIEESFYTAEDELRTDVEGAQPLYGSANQRPGLDDCMERAAEAFEREDPINARMLRFVAQDLDNAELAIEYGAKPPPSEQQIKNIRQRKYHALKQARAYFEPCKE